MSVYYSLPQSVGPTQQDMLNSASFARYLDNQSTMISTFRQEERRRKTEDLFNQNENRLSDLYEKMESASKESPGIVEAVLTDRVDPNDPIAMSLQKDPEMGLVRQWLNAGDSSNWEANSQYSAASNPGTMFGTSGRATGARFAGIFSFLADEQLSQLSPATREYIERARADAEAGGLSFGEDDWGGLGAVADTVHGIGAYVLGDKFAGARRVNEGSELWYKLHHEDAGWTNNKKAREEIAKAILNGEQGKALDNLGVTSEDITEAPSLVAALERINLRTLNYNAGVAMANASTFEMGYRTVWEMIKEMPSDPDTAFEMTATIALGIVTGGTGAAAGVGRMIQKRLALSAARYFKRAGEVNRALARAQSVAGTVSGFLESTARSAQVARKILTPTTWGEEILLPAMRQAKHLRKAIKEGGEEALAIQDLAQGSIYGIALRNAFFDVDTGSTLSGALANAVDGSIGELLAYAATRDEEADFHKFVFGDDANTDMFQFGFSGMLESIGQGAVFGTLLGGAIRTTTAILTAPANLAAGNSSLSDYKNLISNIKEARIKRREGIVQSTLMDLAMGGIRSRHVVVRNLQSSAIAQGKVDPDDPKQLQDLERLVDIGIASGISPALLLKRADGDPVKVAKLIKKLRKTAKAKTKRKARQQIAERSGEDVATATEAAHALNTSRVDQMADNNVTSDNVDEEAAINTAIENTEGRTKEYLEKVKAAAETSSQITATTIAQEIVDNIEGFDDLPESVKLTIVNAFLEEQDMNPIESLGEPSEADLEAAEAAALARAESTREAKVDKVENTERSVTREQLERSARKGGFKVAQLRNIAEMMGITFGKGGDLPKKATRAQIIEAILERQEQDVEAAKAAVPLEVDSTQERAELSTNTLAAQIQQTNGANTVIAQVLDHEDTHVLTTEPGAVADNIRASSIPTIQKSLATALSNIDVDATNPGSLYSPKDVAQQTATNFNKLKAAIDKLPQVVKDRITLSVGKYRDKNGKPKPGSSKEVRKALLDEFDINVGIYFDEAGITPEDKKGFFLTAEEQLVLYEQLSYIAALDEADLSDLTEAEKTMVGDTTKQAELVRQAAAAVRKVSEEKAKRGEEGEYVTFDELVRYWPEGHHNLLHSAFGDAKAVDYSNKGEILFHLPMLRILVQERLARVTEDIEFRRAYRKSVKERIAQVDAEIERTDGVIRNKLVQYRNRAMLELTASQFIRDNSVNSEVTTKIVEDVIEKNYSSKDKKLTFKQKKAKYMEDQGNAFVLGIVDGFAKLPKDSPAISRLARKMGVESLLLQKGIFTPEELEVSARRELARKVAAWASSQEDIIFGDIDDSYEFSGMEKLWDGSIDAVDGYTAGRALVEAVTNFREFGSREGVNLATDALDSSDSGYLGHMSNRAWFKAYEQFVQDRTNEHVLFNEDGSRKVYSETDIEDRLSYYDNIEKLIDEERWDELAEFIQDTPYQADLKKGIAPAQLIKDLKAEIQTFRQKYKSRVEFARSTPSAVIHTLHDQAASLQSAAAAFHIFGNLPVTQSSKVPAALVNAVGDTGLKTAVVNPGSFKDAWAVKSSRIWGTAEGMANFARAAGRVHLAKVMDELKDDPFGLLTAIHDLDKLEIELETGEDGKITVKIANDEDASAQAVTVAQSIFEDYQARNVQGFISERVSELKDMEKEAARLSKKNNKSIKEKKKLEDLREGIRKRELLKNATVKVDKDGVLTIENLPDEIRAEIPGLNQREFRDFLQTEVKNLHTIGGGNVTAEALTTYMDNYTSEKGEDNYSNVGLVVMERLKDNPGWRAIYEAAGLADKPASFKETGNPVAKFLRNEIFKPPVMTTVYSAGARAHRATVAKALRSLLTDEARLIPDAAKRAEIEAAIPQMTQDLVNELVGKNGAIQEVLGLPDTETLVALLNKKNALETVITDENGLKETVTLQQDQIVDSTLLATDPKFRAAVLRIGSDTFGDEVPLALAYWATKLKLQLSTGEISKAAYNAALRRVHEYIGEANVLAAQEGVSFEEAMNRVAKPVSSYLTSMELMNRVGYLPHKENILEYMKMIGVEMEDLDALTRAHLLHNIPLFARNRGSTGRSNKITDASAGTRPLQGESSTEETIGLGDEQLGTRNLADSLASIVADRPEDTGSVESLVLQDMEMELGGIIKPMGFKSPEPNEFVRDSREFANSSRGKASRKQRNDLFKRIDDEIEDLKNRAENDETFTNEEIRKLGMLVEIKKILVARDEKGEVRESLDRNFLPSSLRPERRLSAPNPADGKRASKYKVGQHSNPKAKIVRVAPTQLGVPALQALRTRLNNRTLIQRDADQRAAANLNVPVGTQPVFSVSEMVTASPIPDNYVAGIEKESVKFNDKEYIDEEIVPIDSRTVGETRSEIEAELEQVEDAVGDDADKIQALRAANIAARAAGRRRRSLDGIPTDKEGRRAAIRQRLRSDLQKALNLTFGGISVDTLDTGRNMFVIDRAGYAPGRGFKNQRLTTFGEVLPNYAAQNRVDNLVGLAIGPVEASNIHVKGGNNVLPKLTSRGPISVFFHDWMLIGGASREFTVKAYVAMFMDSPIEDPQEFVNYINERGFMAEYVAWNERKFGVDASIDSGAEARVQFLDKFDEKVKFWNEMEAFENGTLEGRPEFQEAFNKFYDGMFEEMATAFPGFPQISADPEAKVMFYGILDTLNENPEFKAFLFNALGMNPEEHSNEAVATAFALSRTDVENNFFEPVIQGFDADGNPIQSTFGALYNSLEVADTTVATNARPTFTAMQMLHMANLSKNAETMHKLMTAAMLGVDIELDLSMSQRLRERSDAFDTVTPPLHGFSRTPINENDASQNRQLSQTDSGFNPAALGRLLKNQLKEQMDESPVLSDIFAEPELVGLAHVLLSFGLVEPDGTIHQEAEFLLNEFNVNSSIDRGVFSKVSHALAQILSELEEQTDAVGMSQEMGSRADDPSQPSEADLDAAFAAAQARDSGAAPATQPPETPATPGEPSEAEIAALLGRTQARAEGTAEPPAAPVTETPSAGEPSEAEIAALLARMGAREETPSTTPTEPEPPKQLTLDERKELYRAGLKDAEVFTAPDRGQTIVEVDGEEWADKAQAALPPGYTLVPFGTESMGEEVRLFRYEPLMNETRVMVLVQAPDGRIIPFYVSTGEGGKKNVPTGYFYPVGGIDGSGWLMKSGGDHIPKFYGSEELREVAMALNSVTDGVPMPDEQFSFDDEPDDLRVFNVVLNSVPGTLDELENGIGSTDLESGHSDFSDQFREIMYNMVGIPKTSEPVTTPAAPEPVTPPAEIEIPADIKAANANRTFHSGGAAGADTTFQVIADEFGFTVKAHSFKGHRSRTRETTSEMVVEYTPEQLAEADDTLKEAAERLDKNMPSGTTRKLQQRTYHNIKQSDQVIAVAYLQRGGGGKTVMGGTGWAIEMAKILKKPIYLWNPSRGEWMVWSTRQDRFVNAVEPPRLSDNTAGIGHRDLPKEKALAAKEAIRDLFREDTRRQVDGEEPAPEQKSYTEAVREVEQKAQEASQPPLTVKQVEDQQRNARKRITKDLSRTPTFEKLDAREKENAGKTGSKAKNEKLYIDRNRKKRKDLEEELAQLDKELAEARQAEQPTSTDPATVTPKEKTQANKADRRLLITRVNEINTPEGQAFGTILANQANLGNAAAGNALTLFLTLTGREGNIDTPVSDFEAMQLVQLALVDDDFGSMLFGGNVKFNTAGEISVDLAQHSGQLTRTMNGVNEVGRLLREGNLPAALSVVVHELGESAEVIGKSVKAANRQEGQKRSGDTRSNRMTFLRDFLTPEGLAHLEAFVDTLGIRNERVTRYIKRLKELQGKYGVTLETAQGVEGYQLVKRIAEEEPDFETLSREAFTHIMTAMLLAKAGKYDPEILTERSAEFKQMFKKASTAVYKVLKKIQELTAEIGIPVQAQDLFTPGQPYTVWGWMDPNNKEYFDKMWERIGRVASRAQQVYSISEAKKFKAGNGTDGTFQTVYLGGDVEPEPVDATELETELAEVEKELKKGAVTMLRRQELMARRIQIRQKLDALTHSLNGPEADARMAELRGTAMHDEFDIIDPRKLDRKDREFVRGYLAEKALAQFRAAASGTPAALLAKGATMLASAEAVGSLPASKFDDIRALLVAGNPTMAAASKSLPGWRSQQMMADAMSRELQNFYQNMGSYFRVFNKAEASKDPVVRDKAMRLKRDIYVALRIKDPARRRAAIESLSLEEIVRHESGKEGTIMSRKQAARLRRDLTFMGDYLFKPDTGLIPRLAELGYRAGIFSEKERDSIKATGNLPYLLNPIAARDNAFIEELRDYGVRTLLTRFNTRNRDGSVFVNAKALRSIGAIMTEPVGSAAAKQQFLEMPDELRVALVDLADSLDPDKRPDNWDSMEDWDKAAWASDTYFNEQVNPEERSVSLLRSNPILEHYKKGLENNAEFAWNAERDGATGELIEGGRTRAAIDYARWQEEDKPRNYDREEINPEMGLLEDHAKLRTIQLGRSGLLTTGDHIFGKWSTFFNGRPSAGRLEANEAASSYQEYDIFKVIGSLFKGRVGDSFNTTIQQSSLGMQGMDYLSLLNHLERKLANKDSLFSIDGEMRKLTDHERSIFKKELGLLRDQNDTLFMRRPEGSEPIENSSKLAYSLSSLGISMASAGNWSVSVLAEVGAGFFRSIANLLRGDLQVFADYLAGVSKAKRRRTLENINAHEYAMHKIGVVSKLGDLAYEALDESRTSEANTPAEVGIRILDGFTRGLRSFVTLGFTSANEYTRFVSTVQGIRRIHRFQEKGKFKKLGELLDSHEGEISPKELRGIARLAGMPPDIVSILVNGGVTNSSQLADIDFVIANYLKGDTFDYDSFHSDLYSGKLDGEFERHQAAFLAVSGMINEFNRRNNLDPTFGNRQVPKTVMARLLASLGQFPILAFTRARQAAIQGGIAGLIGMIIPMIAGEVLYSTIQQMAREDDPREVLNRYIKDPMGASLNVLENLPFLGRLQPLQTTLMQAVVGMLQGTSDPDFLSGYKRQHFSRSMVNIPGLDMLVSKFMQGTRAINKMLEGDYNEGSKKLLLATPAPIQPLYRMIVNYAYQNDPLLAAQPAFSGGGSSYSNRRGFRGRSTPFGDYMSSYEDMTEPRPEPRMASVAPELVPEAQPPVQAETPERAPVAPVAPVKAPEVQAQAETPDVPPLLARLDQQEGPSPNLVERLPE